MTRPFWVASGFSLDQIAALTTGRLLATLAGAALGGRDRDADRDLSRRSGRSGWCSCCRVWATAAAAAASAGKSPIAAAALFENFAAGLGTAAFLAFLMSVCERRYAATQFALLSAVYALSRWAAGLMSGVLAERLGFAALLLLHISAGVAGLPAAASSAVRGGRASRRSAEAARHGGGGEHHEDHKHGLPVARCAPCRGPR